MNLDWLNTALDALGVTDVVKGNKNSQSKLRGTVASPMTSKAGLMQLALDGNISPDITTIVSGYHTTPGDGGGISYRRCNPITFASYMLTDATAQLVSFPDANGDYWIINSDRINLAAVGCFGQQLGAVPVITADVSCTSYLMAISEFLAKTRPNVLSKGIIEYGAANYYCHTSPTLDDGVGLTAAKPAGREAVTPADIDAVSDVNYLPGLVLNSTAPLKVGTNFYSDFIVVKRAGIAQHTNLVGALDAQLAFAGTGITKKLGFARNVTIKNFVAYGFAFGIDGWKMHGCRIGDSYGDCLTLVMVRDLGDTAVIGPLVKRRPSLTNNAAIASRTVQVLSIFNSGGFLGLNLAEDVIAQGLTTGQKVGNNKLPLPIVNKRFTATVVNATTVVFNDVPWDSAYASFTLTSMSSISWQPGCSTAVTAIYNSGGKVGIRTSLSMPFKVGHYAIYGNNGSALDGMYKIQTVVSTTDFVLDFTWDASLSSVSLPFVELTAMPNARYHPSVISYWGTNQAYGAAAVNSDGVRCEFANKGGSGFYADCASAHIEGANEGPQTGELDVGPTDTIGLHVTQPRIRATGDFKSTGIAVHVDMSVPTDVFYGYGIQASDGGRASLKVSKGRAVISGLRLKGLGRIILNGTSGVDILEGDAAPSNFAGNTLTDLQYVASRWRDGITVNEIAGIWQKSVWDAAGNELVIARYSTDGFYGRGQAYTSTGGTGSNVVTLTKFMHDCDIELVTNTATISFDATTVPDGFKFTVRNHRPAGDWTIPTSFGTNVVTQYALGAVHTKLKALGWATFVVRDVSGTRYVFIRGDTGV